MYYPHTSAAVRSAIAHRFGVRRDKEICLQNHVLWMLDEIAVMDTASVSHAVKAGRWLGWVLRAVESDLELWSNEHSRDLVRTDSLNGHDVPHGAEACRHG